MPNDVCAADLTFAGVGDGLREISRLLLLAGHEAHDLAPVTFPAGKPDEVLDRVAGVLKSTGPFPLRGVGSERAMALVTRALATGGLDLSDPMVAAHLQPPALMVAAAADALASLANASLDSYDSGPATLAIERWVIDALRVQAGLGFESGGVMTPGGSVSNLLALQMARDTSVEAAGFDVRVDGIQSAGPLRVFCSELAHFSVERACVTLGLGEQAVVPVGVDADFRMRPDLLLEALEREREALPVAIVATAGTTDFGSFDPLPKIAEIAQDRRIWLHVDAAYGFGASFSESLARLLEGLNKADSITLDLHKIGWQPAAASVVLVARSRNFKSFSKVVPYLSAADDDAEGMGGLLGSSIQTTRRADALKVAATLLALGRDGLGEMLDGCHGLAVHAQQRIHAEPHLELISLAVLTTVTFRVRVGDDSDYVNAEVRRRLLMRGTAVIGRTTVRLDGSDAEAVCLKLTLLNPNATTQDVDSILAEILSTGAEIARLVGTELTKARMRPGYTSSRERSASARFNMDHSEAADEKFA